ncbi:DUF2637 domain-containing protein [Streptomyces sp. NPDC046866]|uniref:DUF2637 domain-containing protein n=1 Tax=Streptomyces sp. NPDC046866 TaxID=3154921 RepID=UPI003455DCF4
MRDFLSGSPFESPQSPEGPEDFYAATHTQAWHTTGQMSPDPTEELGFLLQETMAAPYESPPVRQPPNPYALHPDGLPSRRRRRSRRLVVDWMSTTSFSIATLAATLVTVVSLFGGIIAYEPLRRVAELRTPSYVADWWPLLVYGPWAVASLSILRAALHQRRALHSWLVVLAFSGTAILLCLAQAPKTLTDEAAAALPQMASLACLHQLVRLITLTKPPRKTGARHRTSLPRFGPSAPPSAPRATRPPIPRSRRPF